MTARTALALPVRHRQPRLLLAAALACAASIAFAPASAHAQLGKLVKKVADKKVADANANTASGPPPTYDQTLIELGPDQVNKLISGLTATRNTLVGTGNDGVLALGKRRDDANNRVRAIDDAHGKQNDAYQKALNDNDACRNNAIAAAHETHEKQAQARVMSDPSFQQKYMEMSRQMAAANAQHDTVTLHKLQLQLQQTVYPYAKDDTAAADSKCGKAPPVPAWYVERDTLIRLSNKLGDKIRDTQQAAAVAGARTSGLTPVQFAMAQERVIMFVQRARDKQRQVGFSQKEVDALMPKESELERLVDDIQKASAM